MLICYCWGHCPGGVDGNGTCEARPGSQCFAAIEEIFNPETGIWETERTYGCLPPHEKGFMQCKGQGMLGSVGKSIECCSDSDLCNRALRPGIATPAPPPPLHLEDALPYLTLLLLLTLGLVIFALLAAAVYLRYRKKEESGKHYLVEGSKGGFLSPHPHTLHDLIDQSSGSGSGLPLLVQRTIAKQIHMVGSVGKGRYGEVWLARWRGEKVAVKVFFTTEEASWFRETEIYQSVLMRHDNILGFIAADIKGTGSWTQMLLITDYHELGSLYDYLRANVLDPPGLLRLATSVAAGLTHLHTEVVGTRGKPAIAHRDIKSRNILVKTNGEVAIADFGLAVRYISEKDEIDITPNTRVGTRRYMAPEVLDESLDTESFEAFKKADMYSLGLVFWEMTRRCASSSGPKDKWSIQAEDYALPYHDVVPNDPTFEDMHAVVCLKKIRPPVHKRWKQNEVTSTLSDLMQELWHPNSFVRLTSLRVKKTLCKLNPDTSIKIV